MRPVRWSANSEIYSQPLASVKLQRCIQEPALINKEQVHTTSALFCSSNWLR